MVEAAANNLIAIAIIITLAIVTWSSVDLSCSPPTISRM